MGAADYCDLYDLSCWQDTKGKIKKILKRLLKILKQK